MKKRIAKAQVVAVLMKTGQRNRTMNAQNGQLAQNIDLVNLSKLYLIMNTLLDQGLTGCDQNLCIEISFSPP